MSKVNNKALVAIPFSIGQVSSFAELPEDLEIEIHSRNPFFYRAGFIHTKSMFVTLFL